jgi:hypothetical protein
MIGGVFSSIAQTVNQGLFSTTSVTEVSTYFDFTNEATGNVMNGADK